MTLIRQLLRLFTINRVLIRHGLDEFLLHIPVFRPLRYIYYALPWNWKNWKKTQEKAPIEVRIRLALEDLGPIYIKLGQMLSTRHDLVRPDIADELRRLQDRVPPFSSQEATQIIERSLGKPIAQIFEHFETTPLASASIAQVHAATLWSGEQVIVKVVRPTIRPVIEQDITLMYLIANMLNRYWGEARRLHPVEVVEEYERTILDELDLVREAANASQLRRNFEDSDSLYVPSIYWDYCHDSVMVMERIYGIPVGDLDVLKEKNVNHKRLAEIGVEIFFTQVFRHNFFHADMHPGNIFINADNPDEPSYIAVDFGIVGTLTPEDQRYLAENFHAFFNRNYKRVAELHLESGWVPSNTRVNEFEAAIRTVCEPIFNRPIKEISFGYFLLRLFQTARRFDMEVQPQLVLLQKTLLNIEGLGRQLYPDLDLWSTAKPFLQRWMDEQVGIRSLFNSAKGNLPRFIEQLPHMPVLMNELIKQTHDKQLAVQFESKALENITQQMQEQHTKLMSNLAGIGFLISAILLYDTDHSVNLFGLPLLSTSLGLISLLLILYSFRRRK